MSRVVVIGIDGADLQLIEPWASAGQLPTLARLMQQGAVGPLRSTVRPESSVAWTTFSTGMNPGNHGIFGFVGLQTGTYQYRMNNAHHIHRQRFWQIAGAAGKRVIVLNVPMTYPPQPVHGALVAGMLTPNLESDFTYPPELKDELQAAISGYVIDVDKTGVDDREYIQQLIASVQRRGQAIQYLARTRDWDLLVAVFTETDRLQHFFWADMDTNHPLHQHTDSQAILQVYREIDLVLEQLLTILGNDVQIVLVSDHGFNGCARRFYVNTWLQKAGMLQLTPTIPLTGRLESWLRRLRRLPWLRAIKRRVPGLRSQALARTLQQQTLLHLIDWGRTQAFFSDEGAIRINLQGREPRGIVSPGPAYEALRSSLITQLLALRDPLTGQHVVAAAYRREELYSGPHVADAPDLIIEPQRNNAKAEHNFILVSHTTTLSTPTIFDWSTPYTANHTLDGILIAYAQDRIAPLRYSGARIEDIAPTVLAMLGVPLPGALDGRVLAGMFLPDVLQVRYTDIAVDAEVSDSQVFTASEEETIRTRLQDLGYLG